MVNFLLIVGGLALGVALETFFNPDPDFEPTDQKVNFNPFDFTDDD